MEDSTADTPRAPQPRSRAGISIAFTVGIVATAAAAFLSGRLSAPDATSAVCEEAQATSQTQLNVAQTANAKATVAGGTTPEGDEAVRTAAIVMTQNPECFSPGDRAAAQSYLTRRAEGIAQDAARCASAVNRTRWWTDC